MSMQNQWNKTDRRKTCPSGTSTITDPTRTGLGSNPGLHDDRPCLQQICILIKTWIFWDMTPCCYQHFRGACCFCF